MQEKEELTTAEKARLMRNAYYREWRKKNPDKVRKAQERYYAKQYDRAISQMLEDFAEGGDVNG